MFARLLVYFAYSLKTSSTYSKTKLFFYNLLENPESRYKSYFDLFMICLVMMSVFLLIYEVGGELGNLGIYFENFVVCVFIIEYLLRAWLASDSHKIIIEHFEKTEYLNIRFSASLVIKQIVVKKLEYIFSPFALIDLLAILPSYRPLRILRIFLIFRLFKLFRYSDSMKVFVDVLSSKRFELYTLLIFLGFLIFIGSTAIYLFENKPNGGQLRHLYDAFYWAIVTISTVGYGDITPQTVGGRLVTVALIITGLGVLSFFTSIIVAAFQDKMHVLRENRTYAELERYKNYIIICGFGRVGQEIARQLDKDQENYIVIDKNVEAIVTAKRKGILAIHDDASKNEVLENAGINRGATAVLCTTGNDVANVYITLSGRYLNADIHIISRANRKENVKKLYQAGADFVIQPFEIAGLLAAEYIGEPVAFEAILGILREEKQVLMETVVIQPGCLIEGKNIGMVNFVDRKLTLVGVISSNPVHQKHKNRYKVQNQHFYFNPAPHFIIQAQDILVVLGREYSIDHLRDQIETSRLKVRSAK